MPRESVNPIHYAGLASVSDGESPGYVAMPTVEVGWMRELGDVQIGLETPQLQDGQYHLVDHLYGRQPELIAQKFVELLAFYGRGITDEQSDPDNDNYMVEMDDALLGRVVLDAVTAVGQGHTGWYTRLDRAGVNRMIVLLKKAGQAAFGKDQW